MLSYDLDKYDQYKFEYDQFVKSKTSPRYSALSLAVTYNSEVANLMKYESLGSRNDAFLIVPSIFNSPEILFLSILRINPFLSQFIRETYYYS